MIKSWDNAIFCMDTSWFLVSTFLWIFAVACLCMQIKASVLSLEMSIRVSVLGSCHVKVEVFD